MNDTPVLKTPGEMITEARESRELSIAQLSERTKIPPPVLAALEMDEYHKISGPLYIKSFLRTCAVDLGLDPESVLSLYSKISGEQDAGTPGAETVWGEDQVKVSRIGLPWLRITMIVGVLAVAIGLGLFALRGCGDEGSPSDDLGGAEIQRLSPEESVAAGVSQDTAGGRSRIPSLIDPSIEADLQQMATPAETVTVARDLTPDASSLPDSFSHDWMVGSAPVRAEVVADVDTTVADPGEEVAGADDSGIEAESGHPAEVQEKPRAVPVEETVVEESAEEEIVPEEMPASNSDGVSVPVQDTVEISGGSGEGSDPSRSPVPFMDSSWPLVLSITCEWPQDIRIKRDNDREFSGVRWPGTGETAPEVPDAGFEAGRAYSLYENLVVFWGANDHFEVILENVRGVEVAINGKVHDISRMNPGQEFVLDASATSSGRRR